MRHTKRSRLLVQILVVIVIFMSGLNLGKYIQGVDNTYVPPSPTPTPEAEVDTTENAPVTGNTTYSTHLLDDCGVSFLVPDTLTERETGKLEAEFTGDAGRVFVSCNDTFVAGQEELFGDFEASQEAKVVGQSITQYADEYSDLWVIRNKKRQRVLFDTSPGLTPLIQQTLTLE